MLSSGEERLSKLLYAPPIQGLTSERLPYESSITTFQVVKDLVILKKEMVIGLEEEVLSSCSVEQPMEISKISIWPMDF